MSAKFRLTQELKNNRWYAEAEINLPQSSGKLEIISSAYEIPSEALKELAESIRVECSKIIEECNKWLSLLRVAGIKHDTANTEVVFLDATEVTIEGATIEECQATESAALDHLTGKEKLSAPFMTKD